MWVGQDEMAMNRPHSGLFYLRHYHQASVPPPSCALTLCPRKHATATKPTRDGAMPRALTLMKVVAYAATAGSGGLISAGWDVLEGRGEREKPKQRHIHRASSAVGREKAAKVCSVGVLRWRRTITEEELHHCRGKVALACDNRLGTR